MSLGLAENVIKLLRNIPLFLSAKYIPSDWATAAGRGLLPQYIELEPSTTTRELSEPAKFSNAFQVTSIARLSSSPISALLITGAMTS